MKTRRELTEAENLDAARLREAWAEYKQTNPGVTQEWLGRETGLGSQGAVGQYLRAVIPLNLPALLSFSRVLKVGPETISPRLAKLIPPTTGVFGTPVVPIEIGAKTPEGYVAIAKYKLRYETKKSEVQWEVDPDTEPQLYSLELLKRRGIAPENFRCVLQVGDSMTPTIYDGDLAFIDCGDQAVRDGNVYLLRYGDGFRIKRLMKRFDGSLVLVSDNKKYPDEVVSEEQAAQFVTVLGRVRDRSGSGGLE
jgi:hypothetical protein